MDVRVTFGRDSQINWPDERYGRIQVSTDTVDLGYWQSLGARKPQIMRIIAAFYFSLFPVGMIAIPFYVDRHIIDAFTIPVGITILLSFFATISPILRRRIRVRKDEISELQRSDREITFRFPGQGNLHDRVVFYATSITEAQAIEVSIRDTTVALPHPVKITQGRDGRWDESGFLNESDFSARVSVEGSRISITGNSALNRILASGIFLFWFGSVIALGWYIYRNGPHTASNRDQAFLLAYCMVSIFLFALLLRKKTIRQFTYDEIHDLQRIENNVTFLAPGVKGPDTRYAFRSKDGDTAERIVMSLGSREVPDLPAIPISFSYTRTINQNGFFGDGLISITPAAVTFTGHGSFTEPAAAVWLSLLGMYPIGVWATMKWLSGWDNHVVFFTLPALALLLLRIPIGMLFTNLRVTSQTIQRADISVVDRFGRELSFLAPRHGGKTVRYILHTRSEKEAVAVEQALRE